MRPSIGCQRRDPRYYKKVPKDAEFRKNGPRLWNGQESL